MKCHGEDGTGSPARRRLPEIPDFTDASWQARRADAELAASILEGKGKEKEMPPHREKISEQQAGGLVAYVRAFARTRGKPEHREKERPAPTSFDERYHRLVDQMDDLRRQYREVPQAAPGGSPSKPAESGHREVARQSVPTAPGAPTPRELFRKRCVKCHDPDGTGNRARERLPEIPDFTNPSWQERRTDSKLVASVLDGKGEEMPPQRGKISEEQARGLVSYVRAFAPTKGNSKQGKEEGPTRGEPARPEPQRSSFEERQLSAPPPARAQADSSKSAQSPVPWQSASPTPGTPDVGELFRRLCVKCHGADGTGGRARRRLPEIPDLTDASWQARRADAQLLASILDGKGEEMPPERGKISEEQARGLVTHVRAFASASGGSASAEPEGPAPDELSEGAPPRGFLEKLLRWLGKIHPPAVHFPIALLTAAAVAEFLRMATGKSAFNAISRYCIWFGTLTAVMAGALGWCAGSFRLTDASWVLMTHRWLGTSTVACAVLVLVLSEVGRHRDRRGTRLCFRVSLLLLAALVSITGFFGGAVVFGINHHAWPR